MRTLTYRAVKRNNHLLRSSGYYPKRRNRRSSLAVATMGRVFAWATGPQGFALSAAQRSKHALAVPGADHFLDPDVHVGSLAGPTCAEIQLDLLRLASLSFTTS